LKAIDIFPWNEHFNTGLADVDQQHRKLVELLNTLAVHVAYQTGLLQLNTIIHDLLDYTVYHFQTEERIWQEFLPGDSDELKHKESHAKFVEKVQHLRQAQVVNPTEQVVQDALTFLASWLVSHILESDKKLALTVLAIQSGLEIEAAKERADDQMNGATRDLIDLILFFYGTLTSNTIHLMREIAEHDAAAEALRVKEQHFRTIIDSSPVPLGLIDSHGCITYLSPVFSQSYGYTLQDIPTLSDWWPKAYPDSAYRQWVITAWSDRLATTLRTGMAFEELEVSLHTKQGEIRTVVAKAVPVGGQHLVTFYDITARKLFELELEATQRQLNSIVENIPNMIFMKRASDLRFVLFNRAGEELLGCDRSALLGKSDYDFFPKQQADFFTEKDREVLASSEVVDIPEEQIDTLPQGQIILHTKKITLYDKHGIPEYLLGISEDITERKKVEKRLQLAAMAFTHLHEGLVITDAMATILEVNDAFTRITGYSREEAIGQNPRLLNSGRQSKGFFEEMWRDIREKGHWYGEIWNRRKCGEIYPEMLTVRAACDSDGTVLHYLAMFSDLSLVKSQQRQLEHVTHFDALTALPNRVLFADRLHQAMVQSQRQNKMLAVAFLDLDGFMAVNDRHGHQIGDQLLLELANQLKQSLREEDTLARIGGDEFAAILPDLADPNAAIPALERMLSAAAMPVAIDGQTLQVSVSIGVALYPQTETVDADHLLRQADQAMYQAKQTGRNRYHFFDAAQDREVRGYHENIEEIRQALINDEFLLYFQPKVNMRTGNVIGAEALIRWQHPERGLLLPAVFLPVIEEHPLAIEVGEWVIHQALAQIEVWMQAGIDLPVSVNISACHLQHPDFVDRLWRILSEHPRVHPQKLMLEVLETSALADLVHVSQLLRECKDMGIDFSLDDFGTGYSSLTYLKRLPVRKLKVDQSFVRDMLIDPDDLAILQGVLGLAEAFHREVIAEGVESMQHCELLLRLGCELAQGYGIARPMPAADIPAWIMAWRPDPLWGQLVPTSRDDLPLLFAATEHRAWVVSLEKFLNGERNVPPTLDHRQCRVGQWLYREGQAKYRTNILFQRIQELHQRLHQLGAEMCESRCAQGRFSPSHKIAEIRRLHEVLIEQENKLLAGSGGTNVYRAST